MYISSACVQNLKQLDKYYHIFEQANSGLMNLPDDEKCSFLSEEDRSAVRLTAQFVTCCHKSRQTVKERERERE